jgi:hypothetical protein
LRILILGAGFAGFATARKLERLLRPNEAAVTIVGRDNFALFTPMLPEVGTESRVLARDSYSRASGVVSLANDYLSRLPGLDRQVRVAIDWTLGFIFRRDISELRVYTQRARARAASAAGLEPDPNDCPVLAR